MAPPTAAAAAAGGLVLWLHGSAETGEQSRAQVAPYFSAVPELRLSFPTVPHNPHRLLRYARLTDVVTIRGRGNICGRFSVAMLLQTTARDEKGVLKAVEHVHEMLNKEVAAGTSPTNIFVCGLSQGGALAIASVLLYPKTLGGCVVFSGSVPLSKSFAERVPPEARKTPVLWFHGMADGLVLFEAGQAGCAFLQELGMACEFKAYPTLGHSLVDEELQYFRRWILQRLGMDQGTEVATPSWSS